MVVFGQGSICLVGDLNCWFFVFFEYQFAVLIEVKQCSMLVHRPSVCVYADLRKVMLVSSSKTMNLQVCILKVGIETQVLQERIANFSFYRTQFGLEVTSFFEKTPGRGVEL